MVKFLFSVHIIAEAKQSKCNRPGGARAGARAVDLPARSFDLARPGVAPPLHLIYFGFRKHGATSPCSHAGVVENSLPHDPPGQQIYRV